MEKSQKGFSVLLAVVVAMVVFAGAGSYFYLVKQKTAPVPDGVFDRAPDAGGAFSATTSEPGLEVMEGQSDPTASWQTYQDKDWGINFKYPGDAKIKKNEDNIVIITAATEYCKKDAISRKVATYPCDEFGMDIILERIAAEGKTADGYARKLTTEGTLNDAYSPRPVLLGVINGIEAEALGMAGSYIYIIFKNGDYIYQVSVSKEIDIKAPAVLKQILSTFKFTDNVAQNASLSGWQTYRNEKYGFEIKYPRQYKISAGTIKISETKKINIDTDYCCFPIPSPDKQSKLTINGVEFEKISGTITQDGFSQGVVSYRTSQNAQKKEMQIALIVDLGEVAFESNGNAQIYDISNDPEVKIFDQMLSTFKFIGSKTVNNISDLPESFCADKIKDNLNVFALPLRADKDGDQEFFVGCAPVAQLAAENIWQPGSQTELTLYLVDKSQKGGYQVLWNVKSKCDYGANGANSLCLRSLEMPSIKDIDGDGTDEILLVGSNWGGTCTGGTYKICAYSMVKNDLFCASDNQGYGNYFNASGSNEDCSDAKITAPNACNMPQYYKICFSKNLNDPQSKLFKVYLENGIKQKLQAN